MPIWELVCESCGEPWGIAVVTNRPRPYCPPCRERMTRARNADRQRDHRYRRSYGIGATEVDALVAAQDGRCRICGTVPKRPLVVDHCHSTGRVRAMVCGRCNTLLGYMETSGRDILERAAAYLAEHGSTF